MLKRSLFLLVSPLLLSGCVHTTITEGAVTTAKGPYHKILVCSLSNDAARAVLIEDALSQRLAKHHAAIQTCSSFMAGPPASDAATLSRIRKESFDALLVVQRDTVTLETPPPGSMITRSEITSLGSFLEAFDAMSTHSAEETGSVQPFLYGEQRAISGTVKLIGIQENRIVWAGGGVVKGPAEKPIVNFIESMADRTESDLTDAGMIPPK